MPMINLIYQQQVASRKAAQQARLSLTMWVAVTSLFGLGWVGQMIQSAQMNAEMAKLDADSTKLHGEESTVKQNQRRIVELRPRLQTLEEAQAASSRWHRVLNHFVNQTPSDVWLTGIRSTQPETIHPVAITIVGVSLAQSPVGDLMLRLQNQPDINNLTLKYTQPRVGVTKTLVDFELAGELQGTDEKAPEATKS